MAIVVLRALQPDEVPVESRPVDYGVAITALCEAAELADDGDLNAAHGVFISRAHGRLHELAAAASELDRSVAARLLEAKADVEATLPLENPAAADALDALIAATRTATEAVTDEPAPSCEEKDG